MKYLWLLLFLTAACVDTTGGARFSVPVGIAGPAEAVAGQPLQFTTGLGFQVRLDKAIVHVGAVYLNRSRPTSGSQAQSCVLPGIYVAEALQGADIDALSPQPQWQTGHAVADHAITGEVWLSGGDVNALDDQTVVLDLAGTATREGQEWPFQAHFHIGKNRTVPPSDPSQPGASPLCKQRIVSPIPVDVPLAPGGRLLVRVDPRAWFANVDFSALPPPAKGAMNQLADDGSEPVSANLYAALRATIGVWSFAWQPAGS